MAGAPKRAGRVETRGYSASNGSRSAEDKGRKGRVSDDGYDRYIVRGVLAS